MAESLEPGTDNEGSVAKKRESFDGPAMLLLAPPADV